MPALRDVHTQLDLVLGALRRYPDREAFRQDDRGYTYREIARERGVTRPNVVMPITAHVALDKGAYWMDIEVRHAPLTDAYTADVAAMSELIDDQTIALVGSAGDYGHGLIDPIPQIAALAQGHGESHPMELALPC